MRTLSKKAKEDKIKPRQFELMPLYKVGTEVKAFYAGKRTSKSSSKIVGSKKTRKINDLISEQGFDIRKKTFMQIDIDDEFIAIDSSSDSKIDEV